jgi:uncharacterized phage-associated protein
MTPRHSREKVRQAVAYIASKLPEHGNMYKVLKVMYFADKLHLKRYGRMIFGDRYVALKHGPVPRSAYRKISNERDGWNGARPDPLYKVDPDNTIVPLLNPELEYFSESDIACIDAEIETCRPLSFTQLKARSHDAAYAAAGEDDEISIQSIAAAVAESPEEEQRLLEHLAHA